MPRTQPCSKCGTPKMVGRGSREDVVCLPCRRTPEWRAMMLERQREWSRQGQRKRRAEKREAAGLPPKPPKLDQPCAVCEVMQPRKLCEAHRHWRRVTCHACGIETYSANKPSAKRRVYCKPCSPGVRSGRQGSPSPRACRYCAALVPKGRKACDVCLSTKPWEPVPAPALTLKQESPVASRQLEPGRVACIRCGVVNKRPLSDPATYTCHPCRRSSAEHLAELRARKSVGNRARNRAYGDHRKRARSFGVEYEYVNRRKVFERDGWRCGICRDKIDKRLSYPHPMSASLDHIVPMSLGGGHLYTNTQASHLRCNVLKSNRMGGDQLALIG